MKYKKRKGPQVPDLTKCENLWEKVVGFFLRYERRIYFLLNRGAGVSKW